MATDVSSGNVDVVSGIAIAEEGTFIDVIEPLDVEGSSVKVV